MWLKKEWIIMFLTKQCKTKWETLKKRNLKAWAQPKGPRGLCPPKNFRTYSHFVPWAAVFQTKWCYSLKSNILPPKKMLGLATLVPHGISERGEPEATASVASTVYVGMRFHLYIFFTMLCVHSFFCFSFHYAYLMSNCCFLTLIKKW